MNPQDPLVFAFLLCSAFALSLWVMALTEYNQERLGVFGVLLVDAVGVFVFVLGWWLLTRQA